MITDTHRQRIGALHDSLVATGPEHLNMDNWAMVYAGGQPGETITDIDLHDLYLGRLGRLLEARPGCGYTCCLGGHAAVVAHDRGDIFDPNTAHMLGDIHAIAEYLGCTTKWFYASDWPGWAQREIDTRLNELYAADDCLVPSRAKATAQHEILVRVTDELAQGLRHSWDEDYRALPA